MPQPFDLVILSNGPGEVTTWVRPVVAAVRERFGSLPRISVILSPCSNSTGREAAIARSYPEVDRVQGAEHFLAFLLWGKTQEPWQWFRRGVVLFLGGDQFFPLVIGKRLGFKTLIYAEWEARWYRYIDGFGVMNDKVVAKVPPRFHHKFRVVGDLMVDVPSAPVTQDNTQRLIGLLPGSKAMKLAQGVPFFLAIAEGVKQQRPDVDFFIPVAPTLTLQYLARFADAQQNPVVHLIKGQTAQLVRDETNPYLETASGFRVRLVTDFPAHEHLRQCTLCLTTIGANTAELGALGVPMIIVLPTQQVDAMRAWDGLPGLIGRLPWVGTIFIRWLNRRIFKQIREQKRLYGWPNIWAGREIVPELFGDLTVEQLVSLMVDLLDHPEKLAAIRTDLQQSRGNSGAAAKLTEAIAALLD